MANSPVFATLYEYLGSGIVGGSLLKTEDIGKNAAKIALDYLSGQIKLTEPVTTFATSPLVAFDWRELTRWKADHFPRPEGSIIINRPLTLWGEHKTPVIAAVISFLLLTALLIALSLLNRRLQRAKDEAIVNEVLFREMIERAPEAIILFDTDLKRIVDCNAKAEQLFGCSREKLLQGGPDRFYPKKQPVQDDVITSMDRNSSRAMAGEELVIERFIRSDDGRDLVCEVRLVRLPYQDKKLLRGSFIDITEKKRVQEEIEISRAEFAAIFNSISDGIVFVDTQRHIVRINPAFTRMFGYQLEEIAGQTTQLIYADPDNYLKQGQARFNPGAKVDRPVFENEYRRKDGTTFPGETIGVHVVDETEQLLGYIWVIHDVRERKSAEGKREKLEAQLHQAQKIESIGQLAGGVAHDFNNMLGVILGHAEMALMKAGPSNPLISDLEEIGTAAKHSADLTRQLLTFARKQVIAPKVLDLNESVAGTLKMLQRLIGENIQLSWNATANLWPVKIDPSQLDQILANLCVNARDAIVGLGKISVRTENRTMNESATNALPYNVVPGDYVRLSVSDDGCGMDKQVQAHIFEPFYTTKEIGSGTGLGLATVYGAVKQNHGFLTVYSEPGMGTAFNIYFPRTSKAVEAEQETAEKPLLRGTETVLLVEDDEMLLHLVTTMLEESGYTVMAAATTELAQSFAREHSGPIHLLISDMIMPVMNGLELSAKLQPLRPDMKFLFLSGYTADIISSQGIIKEDLHFLQKPFSFEALTTKVREVLDDH